METMSNEAPDIDESSIAAEAVVIGSTKFLAQSIEDRRAERLVQRLGEEKRRIYDSVRVEGTYNHTVDI